MPTEVLDIAVVAKIDKLRSELEKIPGITAKESKKMAAVWSKDFQRMERATERAMKVAAREAEKARKEFGDKQKQAFDSSRKALSLWGGQAGTAAQMGGDMIESVVGLSSALGPLGASAAVAAFSVAGLGAASLALDKAAVDFARSAVEAHDRLIELGIASTDANAEMERLSDGLTALDASVDGAMVAFASATELGLGPFLDRLVGLVSATSDASGSIVSMIADITESSRQLTTAIDPTGTFESLYEYFDVLEEAGKEQRVATVAAIEGAAALAALDEKAAKEAETTKKATKARRDSTSAAREAQKAVEDWTRSMDALIGIIDESGADLLTQEQQINIQYLQRIQRIDELEQKTGDAELAAVARYEAEQRKIRELDALEAQRIATIEAATIAQQEAAAIQAEALRQVEESADALARKFQDDLIQGQQEAMVQLTDMTLELVEGAMQQRMDALVREENQSKRLHRQAQDQLKTERENIEAQIESGKISEEAGKAQIKQIDDEMRANAKARRQARRDHRAALLEAHKAQKAAAIARATIDAAANAVALTAAFAYLGPGAPAAAVAVAAGQLAIQISAIKATKAPKFAVGGMVRDRVEGDHVPILAEPDEGILTRRGVEAAGGPAGVAALNAGTMGSGGGHGSTRVYLDSRMLGEVVAMSVATDQRVTSALDRQTGAIPGQRR